MTSFKEIERNLRAQLNQFDAAIMTSLFPGFPNYMASSIFVSGRARQCPSTKSLINTQEASAVLEAVQTLIAAGVYPLNIGIVAAYKSQAELLRRVTVNAGISLKFIGSPNATQGDEADFVIISTVRTQEGVKHANYYTSLAYKKQRHGYLTLNRANVASTRARLGQILVCDPFILANHPLWHHHLQATVMRNAFISRMPSGHFPHLLKILGHFVEGIDGNWVMPQTVIN